jgi:hypothetical protein
VGVGLESLARGRTQAGGQRGRLPSFDLVMTKNTLCRQQTCDAFPDSTRQLRTDSGLIPNSRFTTKVVSAA